MGEGGGEESPVAITKNIKKKKLRHIDIFFYWVISLFLCPSALRDARTPPNFFFIDIKVIPPYRTWTQICLENHSTD